MDFIVFFAVVSIGAYVLQFIFGYFQIKHFNNNYMELRRKGRVVIGRKPGKFVAGTIVLFVIDQNNMIVAARLLQGVSVLAKFKEKNEYLGQDIHFIDCKHPLVQKENKFTRMAMEDARNLFIKNELGVYIDNDNVSLLKKLLNNAKILLKNFRKRSA